MCGRRRTRPVSWAAGAAVMLLAACGSGEDPAPAEEASTPAAPSASTSASSTALPATVAATLLADGLTAPIAVLAPPDRPDRLLVLDQAGTVRELGPGGLAEAPPFLDVTDSVVALSTSRDDERGLLALAFSPGFATDRLVYAFRTVPTDRPGSSHVDVLSEFRTDPAGAQVDRATERVLWTHDQQQRSHAAGQLAFDAQGRLLLFLGDGQELEPRDPASPMGSVLRFDLTRADAQPERVASGMRHPWRLSYDAPTGQLLFAEPNFTSQAQEVNVFREGADYGWPLDRPKLCYGSDDPTPVAACQRATDGRPLEPPVAEYGPEGGLIVAGAHVYRGSAIPALADRLVVADWGITTGGTGRGGRLLASEPVEDPPHRLRQEVAVTGLSSELLWFWSLDRDPAGELVLMTMRDKAPTPGGGAVWRLGPG